MATKRLRHFFFLLVGLAVLYHEIWQRSTPSPLGVFTALFLFGLIPAFWADEKATVGPFASLIHLLTVLGGKVPPANAAKESMAEPAEPAARGAQVQAAEPAEPAAPAAREASSTSDATRYSPPESDATESHS